MLLEELGGSLARRFIDERSSRVLADGRWAQCGSSGVVRTVLDSSFAYKLIEKPVNAHDLVAG
jgi:hypothetical protein